MPQPPSSPASDEAKVLAHALIEALVNGHTDDAERLYGQLCEADPCAREMKIYPMVIAAQRNRLLDFYRDLREAGEDHHPELQALCLQRLGDPLWEGRARDVEAGTADPVVRTAMRQLLGLRAPAA